MCKKFILLILTSNQNVLLLSFTSAPSGERCANFKESIEWKHSLYEIALLNNIAKFTKKDNACDALRFNEVSGFTRSRVCSYRFCKNFSEYLLPRYYIHRHNWTGNWVILKCFKEHNISTCFEIFPANTAVRIFMTSGM